MTRQEFEEDMFKSYKVLREFGITDAPYFIPPYEHYNATISSWARQLGLQVINYTPGTLTQIVNAPVRPVGLVSRRNEPLLQQQGDSRQDPGI